MVESRWLRWIGPGLVALGAVGFIASTTLGAGVRPWVPSACAGSAERDRIAAARERVATAPADLRGKPWFRLDPILDDDGSARRPAARPRAGRRAGPPARIDPRPARRSRPARSGASSSSDPMTAPTSRVQADRRRARLRVADRRRARRHPPRDDRSGRHVHLRDARRSRHAAPTSASGDARSTGTSAARQVLGPPPPDARFGRTFSTEFTWDVAGDRLAVQSCGEVVCRIRVISPGGGPTVTLDEPGARPDRRPRRRPGRDVRGVSGTPLPDRLDRPRAPAIAVSLRRRPGWPSSSRPRTARGSSTRSARGAPDDCGPSRPTAMARSTSGRSPTTFGSIRRPSAPAQPRTCRPAGSCSLPMAASRPTPTPTRPQLRHVPDGSTVQLDEALR